MKKERGKESFLKCFYLCKWNLFAFTNSDDAYS